LCTYLSDRLGPKRRQHAQGVMETAAKLASRCGGDPEKASVAGILHDRARDLEDAVLLQLAGEFGIVIDNIERKAPALLHGRVGAELVLRELGINDAEILNAIRYHTTGRSGMSPVETAVYVADFIEPNRSYPGRKELLEYAESDLFLAARKAAEHTLCYLVDKGELIHPRTLALRNSLLTGCSLVD